jgi:hypothetical protein
LGWALSRGWSRHSYPAYIVSLQRATKRAPVMPE